MCFFFYNMMKNVKFFAILLFLHDANVIAQKTNAQITGLLPWAPSATLSFGQVACIHIYVYVLPRKRERERKRQRKRARERERDRPRQTER